SLDALFTSRRWQSSSQVTGAAAARASVVSSSARKSRKFFMVLFLDSECVTAHGRSYAVRPLSAHTALVVDVQRHGRSDKPAFPDPGRTCRFPFPFLCTGDKMRQADQDFR